MENILTLDEAATYLKVAPITLYRKARQGMIPATKLGKSWRFHREQLEEWIKDRAALTRPDFHTSPENFRHLSTRETGLVIRFINILVSKHLHLLERVILYGSRARGDFKDYSDIDLLLVFKSDTEFVKKKNIDMTHQFNLDHDVRFQTCCVLNREWEHPSFRTFLLFEKIRREGISLYG